MYYTCNVFCLILAPNIVITSLFYLNKIHVQQEKDVNEMDEYISHLRSLSSGPIDHLL